METNGLSGSSQGANRTRIIKDVSQLPKEKFQASQAESEVTKQLGGSRSPLKVVSIGGKEINSGAATRASIPPEIGKGSIANLFL
jgi:hypothetical protein